MISGNYYSPTHDEYFTNVTLLSSDEVMPNSVKSQVLNNLKSILEELLNTELLKDEPDDQILLMINANLMVIEDAYNIDLYKFQFQAITNIIGVEIKNIKDLINLDT